MLHDILSPQLHFPMKKYLMEICWNVFSVGL